MKMCAITLRANFETGYRRLTIKTIDLKHYCRRLILQKFCETHFYLQIVSSFLVLSGIIEKVT